MSSNTPAEKKILSSNKLCIEHNYLARKKKLFVHQTISHNTNSAGQRGPSRGNTVCLSPYCTVLSPHHSTPQHILHTFHCCISIFHP